MKIGDRVGAILSADEKTVQLLGYGTYKGSQPIPSGAMKGIPNPQIQLDDGKIVWGYQCWWGSEAGTKKAIGDRTVEMVDIPQEAAE